MLKSIRDLKIKIKYIIVENFKINIPTFDNLHFFRLYFKYLRFFHQKRILIAAQKYIVIPLSLLIKRITFNKNIKIDWYPFLTSTFIISLLYRIICNTFTPSHYKSHRRFQTQFVLAALVSRRGLCPPAL